MEIVNKKYDIIYADPPWDGLGWNKNRNGKRCPARHYDVQSLEWISDLNVAGISNINSSLFLWTTYPCLPLGIEVIKRWGFRYSTVAFTWIKTTAHNKWHIGCGNYTRANPEICLLGIKGTMKRQSKSVRNLVISKIGRHSEKPPEIRDRIVELFGDLPRIELFARNRVDGWDAWGEGV